MSNRVDLSIAGEVAYIPERDALRVEMTLANVANRVAVTRRVRIPWQTSDFHGAVEYNLSVQFQSMSRDLANKIAHFAPNGFAAVYHSGQAATDVGVVPAPLDNPVATQELPPPTPSRRGPGRPRKVPTQADVVQ